MHRWGIMVGEVFGTTAPLWPEQCEGVGIGVVVM